MNDTNETIKNKIYNINLLVDELKKIPGTYKSILGELCKDGTCNTILRRKLTKLQQIGTICKTIIPGTRFGKVLFYHPDKKYYILFESGRLQNNIYCIYGYNDLNKFYIELKKFSILRGKDWIKRNNKVISKGTILKWI